MKWGDTTVGVVLTLELEDLACVHAEELALAVPGFAKAMVFPAVR